MVPAVIALLRFRRIGMNYYPFIILLWIGACNEIITHYVATRNNAINSNIYTLLEGLLILTFFSRLKLFDNNPLFYRLLLVLMVVWWIIEAVLVNPAKVFLSHYIIGHSLVIALLSVQMISRLVGQHIKNLWKQPVFLICFCFVIYFTYAILVEIFWKYNLFSSSFKANVQLIMSIINIITNLVFALAILWIPKRQEYFL